MDIASLLLRLAALQIQRAYVILNIGISLLVVGACYRIRTARWIYHEAKQRSRNPGT